MVRVTVYGAKGHWFKPAQLTILLHAMSETIFLAKPKKQYTCSNIYIKIIIIYSIQPGTEKSLLTFLVQINGQDRTMCFGLQMEIN